MPPSHVHHRLRLRDVRRRRDRAALPSPAAFLSDAFLAFDAWYGVLTQASRSHPDHSQEAVQAAGEVRVHRQGALDGYTLLSYRASTTVHLVDMDGKTVHQWSVPFQKAWPDPPHVHLRTKPRVSIDTAHVFPNGDLLIQYSGLGDTPYGYGLVKTDKDANVLWKYAANAHHDFEVDPDTGNIYALTHSVLTSAEPGLDALTYPLLTDSIVILSPDGRELDRIPLLEAFRDSPFRDLLSRPARFFKQENWDALHTNSIRKVTADLAPQFPLFREGQVLVSVRNMNALAVIDPTTRAVVWVWAAGGWKWQHSARLLPNGHILLLDNLGYRIKNRTYVRAIELDPVARSVVWHFAGSPDLPLISDKYGRVQRVRNGNTVIVVSKSGRVVEVSPFGELLWDYVALSPSGKARTVVNGHRYEPSEVPFLSGRLTY